MNTVFADTGYWIALINRKDPHRLQALQLAQQLDKTRIVTTELVLVELLNFFSNKGPFLRKMAVQAIEDIVNDQYVTVISHTHNLFQSALKRYDKVFDKQWSFVDCYSFEVMKSKRIKEALAYDKHFQQAGFITMLRNEG
jgi:uncharacterized protein